MSCDAAFLPVGGTYTMTAAEAAALANALHPQIAVPTHYGSIVGAMTDGDDFAAQLVPGIRCVKLIEDGDPRPQAGGPALYRITQLYR